MTLFERVHMPPLAGATEWLNAEPLGPAELRGHVVLVNFWTLTCINWLRQEPYVRAWSQAYRDDGLIVIGVHTPEFGFEHESDRVRQAISDPWPSPRPGRPGRSTGTINGARRDVRGMYWWPFIPSELYASLWGVTDQTKRARGDEAASAHLAWWGSEEPSALEMSVLQIVYGFVAPATSCVRCGAPLGRHLQVDAVPTLLRSVLWRVSVRTRCRGWRRHRHRAVVARSPDGLVLGPFRGRSR